MNYMIKIINYFIQSLLIYSFFIIGRFLGLRVSRKIFAGLFLIIGPLFKSKKVMKKNLNIFLNKFPNHDEKTITDNMWKNYGKTFIEYVFLNYFRKQSNVIIKDQANLSQIIQENKPVIFISGHLANFLNPFMEFLRRKYVCKNQIKKGIKGVRKAINYIRENKSIALMIDQRVSEGEKIFFFDKLALTTTLPAQLSTKFGIDIIPVYIERDKNDNFKIEFKKRISSKNFQNKVDLTRELNRVLEIMISKNPGQWIWTHNRWK